MFDILNDYFGDDVHEVEAQNAKMSRLNQRKEENVGFASNLTFVCVSYLNFLLALSKEHSFMSFCMKVLCTSPLTLVKINIFSDTTLCLDANHNRGCM